MVWEEWNEEKRQIKDEWKGCDEQVDKATPMRLYAPCGRSPSGAGR